MEYDPSFEEAYQICMEAHGRMGDLASIRQVYQSCCDMTKRLFDMPPSEETEEIYHRLVK